MKKITLLIYLLVASFTINAQVIVDKDFTASPDANWGALTEADLGDQGNYTLEKYKFKSGVTLTGGELVMTATEANKSKVGFKFTDFSEFTNGDVYKFTVEVKSDESVDIYLRFKDAADVVQSALTTEPHPTYTVLERTATINDITGVSKIQIEVRGRGTSANQVTYVKNWKFEKIQSASVNEVSENVNFDIYPNPVKDVLNISSVNPLTKVEIFDITGKRVLVSNQNQMSVSTLDEGIYVVKLIDQNENQEVKKIVITK